MRITGPVLTLAAVGAVAACVTTANVVLTADPEPPAVEQATGTASAGGKTWDSTAARSPEGAGAPAAVAPPADSSDGHGGGY